MYGKRFVTIIALALAGVAFLAVGAQAATVNASWVGGSGTGATQLHGAPQRTGALTPTFLIFVQHGIIM